MLVHVPAVYAIKEKNKFGHIKQRLSAEDSINGSAIKYSVERSTGFVLVNDEEQILLTVLNTQPKSPSLVSSELVLIADFDSLNTGELDLRNGKWWRNPQLLQSLSPSPLPPNVLAIRSWTNSFRYIEEDPDNEVIGLRKPQLGALHAIHAHWSTTSETATIVMPTGTGKTETMLSALVSAKCERLLVVVPTDALRTQISDKFESLGLLKYPMGEILSDKALYPVVGTLLSKPKTTEELEIFLKRCNVVVTTSALLSGCNNSLQSSISNQCSHLFIDEAHHAEAPTWKEFRSKFRSKRVLQFTATPFREDGQKIDGTLIFVYPLKQAQDEGYFCSIRFHEVYEFNVQRGDIAIAKAAISELAKDETGKHIVMARVRDVNRANEIFSLYQSLGEYESVMIHSKMKSLEIAKCKQMLYEGKARIVVCVDMLGEGFDMPELKIAAFHDIRKSLSVTLQLAGRFTRFRKDLGAPVFIANTALIEAKDELRKLYTQDPDWNALLPDLSQSAIDGEVTSQKFFSGFDAFLDEVPLKDLRPAASMVVYRTNCTTWKPKNYAAGFKRRSSRDKLYHSLNSEENTLVVLATTENGVQWSDVQSIRELRWELFIAVWDINHELLYLHGSGINGEYREIAKALCGPDVQLVVAPEVFKCFEGVKRLILTNVGLEEHLGRQVRYTGRMGSDVESRIGTAVRRTAKRSVLAGNGYESGNKVSVGAAKRGRVWSALRLRIDSFSTWAKVIGRKIADDSIDPNQVLEGTLKPEVIEKIPEKKTIAVDWPLDILNRLEYATNFRCRGQEILTLTYVDIEPIDGTGEIPFFIRVSSDKWESFYKLIIMVENEIIDFCFERVKGDAIDIQVGSVDYQPLESYFTEHAPTVWFFDGSSLEGCEYTELPNAALPPYHPDRLAVMNWTGINIKAESQGESKKPGTIQHRMIEALQLNGNYSVIFDDDGKGESADIVTITIIVEEPRTYIEVELYHLKYSIGDTPGARVDDLYVVCGQAQRSANWLTNRERRTDFFNHLLKRNAARETNGKSSRIERGDIELLKRLKDMSRYQDVRFKVIIVQPGLSKKVATESQLTLLAVTERYLSDTYAIPLTVICAN